MHCQFESNAYQVVKDSNEKLVTVLETLSTLSTTTTSFLMQEHKQNNGTYPPGFVTIPDAEYQLARARHESRADVLAYAPIVEGKNFELWSQYVEENLGWLDEAREVNHRRIEAGVSDEQVYSHNEVERQIWTTTKRYDSSGCYGQHPEDIAELEVLAELPEDFPASPVWIISPPPQPNKASRINYDMTSSKVLEDIKETINTYHPEGTFHDTCELTNVSSVGAQLCLSERAIAHIFLNIRNSSLILSCITLLSIPLLLYQCLATLRRTHPLSVTTSLLYHGMHTWKDFYRKQFLLSWW
jgi:hypothetical protein